MTQNPPTTKFVLTLENCALTYLEGAQASTADASFTLPRAVLDEVIAKIGDRLRSNDRVVTLHLPLDRGDLLAAAHREGEVIDTVMTDDWVELRVVLDQVGVARFAQWRVPA